MKSGNYQANGNPKLNAALIAVALIIAGIFGYYFFIKESKEDPDTTRFSDLPVSTTTARVESFTGKETNTEMQQLILKKDERIIELVRELDALKSGDKTLKPGSVLMKPSDSSAFIRERNMLKQQLQDTENKIHEQADAFNLLKKENEQLASRINQSRNVAAGSSDEGLKSLKNKNALLEKQVDDLNAELKFTKIDCNLSRADVNQIISNSKQRKELLTEALKTLNALSKSEDADIRDKAKEKFSRLEVIAKTLRD